MQRPIPIYGRRRNDRRLTDVFIIESEIAKAIAERLKAKLTGREEKRH